MSTCAFYKEILIPLVLDLRLPYNKNILGTKVYRYANIAQTLYENIYWNFFGNLIGNADQNY